MAQDISARHDLICFQERSAAIGRVQLPSRQRRYEGKFCGLDASSSNIWKIENTARTVPTALHLRADVAKQRSSDPGAQKESAQQGDGCRVKS